MNEAYAGLRLAARAGEPDDTSTQDNASIEDKTKETTMTDQEIAAAQDAAVATARSEATAAANARFNTVLASEHYAGREPLAKGLLANDKLSADDITAALALASKEAPAAAADDAGDLAARQTALAAMDGKVGDLGADAAGGAAEVNAADVWKKAIKANNPGMKLG